MDPPTTRCPHCQQMIEGSRRPYQGGTRRWFPRICPHCNRDIKQPDKYIARGNKAQAAMKQNHDLGHREA